MKKIILYYFLTISAILDGQMLPDSILKQLNFQEQGNNKIYLVGGISCLKANSKINKSLINYYEQENNELIILNELPLSYTYFLNKYLKIKKDSILAFLELNSNIPRYKLCISPFDEFLEKEKHSLLLKHIGIDFEYNDWITYTALKELSRNFIAPNDIKEGFRILNDLFENHNLPSRRQALKFASLIKSSIENNDLLYRKEFGENYYDFKKIIYGLYYGMKYPISKTGFRNLDKREEWMYQNVIEIYNEYPNIKLFGLVDQKHLCKTFQKNWMGIKNWSSLAYKLNKQENSPVKEQVLTVIYYYRLEPVSKDNFYNSGLLNPELRKKICISSDERYSIYNICKMETPFKEFCNVFDYLIVDRGWFYGNDY